jgi:hypothetical protein
MAIDLLGDGERVIDLDAKIPDGAFHLGVPKEAIHSDSSRAY